MSSLNVTPYPTITRQEPASSLVEGRFKVPNGDYIVTIHNERVVKVARVECPIVLRMEEKEACNGQGETGT